MTTRGTHAFFLGTGRCGTQALARILDALEGCSVVHEAAPPLLDEVTAHLGGALPHDELVRLLRATRDASALGGERLSAESNQRLSFVLPALHQAFPDARYVWLVRDGRSVVASMFHRHWYHPFEAPMREAHHALSARNRMRADLVGEMSPQEWSRLGQFERICWYWSYTNRTIESQAEALGLALLRLRLEDLSGELDRVMEFLGLDDEMPETRRANVARRGAPLPWSSWSAAQRAAFERHCGESMDSWYPHWRESWEAASPSATDGLRRALYATRQVGSVFSVWRQRLRRRRALSPAG